MVSGRLLRQRLLVLAFLWAAGVMFTIHAIDFPGSVTDFTRASGGGTLFDLRPSFSAAEVYARLNSYGDAGRANYAFRNLTVDVLLPLSLLPFLYLLMQEALARVPLGRRVGVFLISVPIGYVLLDLIENASVLVLLSSFPIYNELIASALPYVTVVKRACLGAAVLIPLSTFSVLFVRSELKAS